MIKQFFSVNKKMLIEYLHLGTQRLQLTVSQLTIEI